MVSANVFWTVVSQWTKVVAAFEAAVTPQSEKVVKKEFRHGNVNSSH